jgi:hypothetical protein
MKSETEFKKPIFMKTKSKLPKFLFLLACSTLMFLAMATPLRSFPGYERRQSLNDVSEPAAAIMKSNRGAAEQTRIEIDNNKTFSEQEPVAEKMTTNQRSENGEFENDRANIIADLRRFWDLTNTAGDSNRLLVVEKNDLALVSAEKSDNSSIKNSNEELKELFVHQLTALYGEEAVNSLYPEEERALFLTSGKVNELLSRLDQGDSDVTASSEKNKQDFSSVNSKHPFNPEILKTKQESWKAKFQSSIGISPERLSLILGSGALLGVAAVDFATTGGVFTLPSLLHSSGALAMMMKPTLAALHPLTATAITMPSIHYLPYLKIALSSVCCTLGLTSGAHDIGAARIASAKSTINKPSDKEAADHSLAYSNLDDLIRAGNFSHKDCEDANVLLSKLDPAKNEDFHDIQLTEDQIRSIVLKEVPAGHGRYSFISVRVNEEEEEGEGDGKSEFSHKGTSFDTHVSNRSITSSSTSPFNNDNNLVYEEIIEGTHEKSVSFSSAPDFKKPSLPLLSQDQYEALSTVYRNKYNGQWRSGLTKIALSSACLLFGIF